MKQNNHQMIRCGLILGLLGKQAGCTKTDLIRHIEDQGLPRVSMRTLERDLDLLRERFDATIRYDHRSRWYVLESQHSQTLHQLEALIALSAMQEDLRAAIEVLDRAGDLLLMRRLGQYTSPRFLFSVARSLKKSFSLRVEYSFIDTRGTERLLVQPHLLIFEPSSWHLIAWIETEQHFVSLRLDRIQHLEETQIAYTRRDIEPMLKIYQPAEPSPVPGPLVRFQSSESLYYRLLLQPPFPGFRISGVQGKPVWEAQAQTESDAEELLSTFLLEIDSIEPQSLRDSLRQRIENLLIRWATEQTAT